MGRISVPKLPTPSAYSPAAINELSTAVARTIDLLDGGDGPNGSVVAISGAGISVDSGIRAYRGARGSYTINKSYRPIFFHEFLESDSFRRRYWARSYVGYPTVREAEPNVGHYAVAALMKMGYIGHLITQNVDRLHHKAIAMAEPGPSGDSFEPHPRIVELHGTLQRVDCLGCGHQIDRDAFQAQLSALNPEWRLYAHRRAALGQDVKTNPDGDADLSDTGAFDSFVVPGCQKCSGGILKPAVTFFGESLSKEAKETSGGLVGSGGKMLVIGTSLTTYSAFRLVRAMGEKAGARVGLINLGPTRADGLVDWKVGANDDGPGLGTSVVLRAVAQHLAHQHRLPPAHPVSQLLRSGSIRPLD